MYDYLVVGCGLAGIAFLEKALDNNKTVFVINDASHNSSKVAGGLYNPVILKRFSAVWNAKQQLELSGKYYEKLEKKLHKKFDFKLPLYRKFFSIEEQNNWFDASDKVNLSDFLSTTLVPNTFANVVATFGFGEVKFSGYVDTLFLVTAYQDFLKSENCFLDESFNHSLLKIELDHIEYKSLAAKHIIFAEGFGMKTNPYFNYLPLDGTKGELLIIKAPQLDFQVVLKSSIFVVPLGNDLFKVGATYDWKDKSNTPTQNAKNELLTDFKNLINCDFEVIEHRAEIRPTVKDRKPLVGTHYKYKNLHILNGLGTRGVMLAPAMAQELYNCIENKIPIDSYADIKRFKNLEI